MTETAAIEFNRRRTSICFVIAFVLCAGASAFLFQHIPLDQIIIAVPEMGALIALILPILWWQTTVERKKATKIATIASCLIWVIGIFASCTIQPASHLIYLGDSLLLVGFFPLLYLWRFSWPWLVMGVLNVGVGILLLVISYSPDNLFPADLLPPKHHLSVYHPAISWYVCGAVSTIYGIVRLLKNLFKMITDKRQNSATN